MNNISVVGVVISGFAVLFSRPRSLNIWNISKSLTETNF